jgi:hypothetical protein
VLFQRLFCQLAQLETQPSFELQGAEFAELRWTGLKICGKPQKTSESAERFVSEIASYM